jgi:flagellar motility protein MotE (MotC chaperone)
VGDLKLEFELMYNRYSYGEFITQATIDKRVDEISEIKQQIETIKSTVDKYTGQWEEETAKFRKAMEDAELL